MRRRAETEAESGGEFARPLHGLLSSRPALSGRGNGVGRGGSLRPAGRGNGEWRTS